MINFEKKAVPRPVAGESEESRVERTRKAAAEKQLKSDTDGTRRRARQTVDDNKLI